MSHSQQLIAEEYIQTFIDANDAYGETTMVHLAIEFLMRRSRSFWKNEVSDLYIKVPAFFNAMAAVVNRTSGINDDMATAFSCVTICITR